MDALALLRGVQEVAALANPDEPTATAQRAFDSAREHSAKHAELPAARRITEQLRIPWREVLAIAHEPHERQAQLFGVKTRAQPADWLTEEHAIAVLRIIAARRGSDSLTTGEYRVERATILAGYRRCAGGGEPLLIPTDEQLVTFAGSWDAALRLAELRTAAERGADQREGAPTLVDRLARFHETHGFQPSARELRAFARGNSIPYPSERAQRFEAAVAEWKRQRSEARLPEPRVIKRSGGRGRKAPDYSADVGAGRDGERRRSKWTRASCAAAVARYLAQLPKGERSTERGYSD